MQTWFSFQVVEIYGGFGTELLLFQSAVHERSRSDLSQRQRVQAKTAAKGI